MKVVGTGLMGLMVSSLKESINQSLSAIASVLWRWSGN